MPGLNYSYYESAYWPVRIDKVLDELTLQFVEDALNLIPLGPRDGDYDPLRRRNITVEGRGRLPKRPTAAGTPSARATWRSSATTSGVRSRRRSPCSPTWSTT
ncbi:MAG: hypothetical protein M5R36_10205 [Deltaproteobacteria bacterium]|nr:hypothetical protein [Deltaproteobacteria bacterium]